MRLELKNFQTLAVDDLLIHLRAARREATNFPQAVLLSAPTGAGKTVMATAVLEALLDGDDEAPGLDQLTVLWLSDLPDVNEQTKDKMVTQSSSLGSRLVTIEGSFQERILTPGKIYFLNTQKLGRNSGLVAGGDDSPSLWETLTRTVQERPQDFLLVIDEAHRGMSESSRDQEVAQSIAQKFIKGDADIPIVPMILGISATPQRFLTMVAGRRNLRPLVEVEAEDVRESGLLKKSLLVYHPRQRVPSDFSLLESASRRLLEYSKAWEAYEKRTNSSEFVQPVLVVQVANAPTGRRGSVTETDLALAVSVIESVLGPLSESSIGHCFQEAVHVPIGDGRTMKYVSPSGIQKDTDLRVVFFKTALGTGWDCPRAEVMMSFRKAVDHTNIAQLVGRMVRTPLARTIEDDEFLNTCSLYLPHYDRAGLDKVLGTLQSEDPVHLPPVRVDHGEDKTTLHRDPQMEKCFKTLAGLPTYDVVRVRAMSNLRRAVKLARLLDRDGITEKELEKVQAGIAECLDARRRAVEDTDQWKEIVKGSGTIDIRAVEWAIGIGEVSENQHLVPVTQKNVDDLFAAAGRRLGEGLHKVYWRKRAEEDASPNLVRRIYKLEVFALSQDAETESELELFSEQMIAHMQSEYGSDVEGLSPDRRTAYNQIRLTAREPQSRPLGVFEHIVGNTSGDEWEKHIYIDDEDTFHYTFKSSWEHIVLEDAGEDENFVGWLRNEDRKEWALTVPYRMGSDVRPMYPDLITFRKQKSKIVADILDPHDQTREDWLPKVKGLAEYADKHWTAFGKIEASFVERGTIRRLDLRVEANRKAALDADGTNSLKALFT